MNYEKKKDGIFINNKMDFDPKHILDCGQIFRYSQLSNGNYVVYSKDKKATISKEKNGYFIKTDNVLYFENFFDLLTDYSAIKKNIANNEIVKKAVEFGSGIRILKNDLFEMIVSFVISANNNIPRIKSIIDKLCEQCGDKKDGYFAFPTREQLLLKDESFFRTIGAGYRAKYLYKLVRELENIDLCALENMDTHECRQKLISLSGIGPKVADCILLFGMGKKDVFPVDTWIENVYHSYFETGLKNRIAMRKFFVEKFGELSGYVQQYLFYFQRK